MRENTSPIRSLNIIVCVLKYTCGGGRGGVRAKSATKNAPASCCAFQDAIIIIRVCKKHFPDEACTLMSLGAWHCITRWGNAFYKLFNLYKLEEVYNCN